MPHKCIYTHIHQVFTIWSCIQAYKCDANVYGPLWTPTCICAMWTYFLTILYIFPILFFLKRLYHSSYHWQSYDRLSPSSQHHVCLQLLIPKSKLTPRSPSTPRSQPMSGYPLYSSLVFCHSQVPISVTAKHPSPSQPSASFSHNFCHSHACVWELVILKTV